MLNKLFKLIIYTLNIPLYWISYFIPKKKNLWIFGAWFGYRYSDNSKYIFDFVNKNYKIIRGIWLTKSKAVYNKLKNQNYEVYYSYSIKGYIYTMLADKVIVSSGYRDVNRFVINRSVVINLWHATNLKKIGCDADLKFSYKCQNAYGSISYLKYILFPFLKTRYDYVLASSSESRVKMMSAFCVNSSNVIVTGLPRTDILKKMNNNNFTIAYLPTFREITNYDYFENFNIIKMDEYFKKNKIKFLYKTHYADKNTWSIDTEHIEMIKNDDIYEILTFVDILITDYSSVYFDYCLTDRPMIFTPFDYEAYISHDRKLYYDYNEVTPGPKCYNWEQVVFEINKILEGNDEYSNQRRQINEKFNRYQDFNNRRRLIDKIIKLPMHE
jgi:CDP-glycerol glycerophosphotransferase (TagB/SpsB family)